MVAVVTTSACSRVKPRVSSLQERKMDKFIVFSMFLLIRKMYKSLAVLMMTNITWILAQWQRRVGSGCFWILQHSVKEISAKWKWRSPPGLRYCIWRSQTSAPGTVRSERNSEQTYFLIHSFVHLEMSTRINTAAHLKSQSYDKNFVHFLYFFLNENSVRFNEQFK